MHWPRSSRTRPGWATRNGGDILLRNNQLHISVNPDSTAHQYAIRMAVRIFGGPESHLWVSVQIKGGEIASKSCHILTKNVKILDFQKIGLEFHLQKPGLFDKWPSDSDWDME